MDTNTNKTKSRTTLQHIAEDTGLSISTISRVLSRSKRTHTKNEAKILASAKKLNYPFIQSMPDSIGDRPMKIALVTEIFEGEFYSSLFYGFYQASLNSNVEFSFVEVNHLSSKPAELISSISRIYDAICIFLPEFKREDYLELKNMMDDTPIVSLAPIVNPLIDTVTFDAYRGGHLAASHFEEMGFTKVGVIAGPRNKVEALYRKNGFIDHITAANNMECVWVFEGDYSLESGYRAYADLKKHNISNIAIFGSNDQTCFGFIKHALLDGRQIPEDIAITGYDDLPFCKIFIPELTSVSTSFYELAKATISLLQKKLYDQNDSNGNHGHINLVPVSLSVRASTLKN
ncbi:MAG: LacI family DNA-binding transcriptional regulator [Candidatus Marinimicrobia bacterium]|nr:LacI family DNA-binding transcriptional regulator [Candidatus Neomarinimicrobiota bacterium]